MKKVSLSLITRTGFVFEKINFYYERQLPYESIRKITAPSLISTGLSESYF